MSLIECDETNQTILSCYACFFFIFLSFILFSAFFLSSKICYFRFLSDLNEKSRFDLVLIFVKIKIISPPETITDTMRQTIYITKGVAYDNTSSVTINFYNEFFDVL